jgi:hypothetical protein
LDTCQCSKRKGKDEAPASTPSACPTRRRRPAFPASIGSTGGLPPAPRTATCDPDGRWRASPRWGAQRKEAGAPGCACAAAVPQHRSNRQCGRMSMLAIARAPKISQCCSVGASRQVPARALLQMPAGRLSTWVVDYTIAELQPILARRGESLSLSSLLGHFLQSRPFQFVRLSGFITIPNGQTLAHSDLFISFRLAALERCDESALRRRPSSQSLMDRTLLPVPPARTRSPRFCRINQSYKGTRHGLKGMRNEL